MATVRKYNGEEYLNISFKYSDDIITERQFNFKRLSNEIIRDSFARIKANLAKCYEKKTKKRKKSEGEAQMLDITVPSIYMTRNGDVLSETTLNSDAWTESSMLSIGSKQFKIEFNPPSVTSITLPENIMAGYPIHPYVTLDFAVYDHCKFVWYKSELNISDKNLTKVKLSNPSSLKWIPLTTEAVYIVKNCDIGHMLRVVCYPRLDTREGEKCEAFTTDTVGAGTGECPYHQRHELTVEKLQSPNFRVVTYNILADCYASTNYSHEHLFSHCSPFALSWNYRKQLLLDEIMGYNSDIICLQEVDKKLFESDLEFFFKSLGFNGIFDTKGDQMLEGLACFYNVSKFRFLNQIAINLGKEAQSNEVLAAICEKVNLNPELSERFFNRSTILQITELELINDPKKKLLVCNTHLYFHPNADHIRLLQASVCILYIQHLLALKQDSNSKYGVIFCGDFNSCPEFGVYQLFTNKSVTENIEDWNSCPGEEVKNLSISHNLNMKSAYGCPEYTNYTPLFSGCLDYIFYSTNELQVMNNIPLPSHEQVVSLAPGIPNATFPSDHLSLISEFCWKN